jgi:hypothetical protein
MSIEGLGTSQELRIDTLAESVLTSPQNKGSGEAVGKVRAKVPRIATIRETVDLMAEGHPGVTAVIHLVYRYAAYPIDIIMDLDDMNMRGLQIWHAWDICGQDIDMFILRVADRDPKLVEAVNALLPDEPERAVTYGGTDRHRYGGIASYTGANALD